MVTSLQRCPLPISECARASGEFGIEKRVSVTVGIMANRDVNAFCDPEFTRRPSAFCKRLANDLHLFGEVRRRLRSGAEEAVAVLDRPAQRRWMVAAKPDRRIGFGKRFGVPRRGL